MMISSLRVSFFLSFFLSFSNKTVSIVPQRIFLSQILGLFLELLKALFTIKKIFR